MNGQPNNTQIARDGSLGAAGQQWPEVAAGVRGGRGRDDLRRALDHEPAAGVSSLRAEVDDPIGSLDHVEVVLDDQDGMAGVDQSVEDRDELPYVLEMEPGCRFVKKVELPSTPLAGLNQFPSDLKPLGFASRQGGSRLA